MRSGFNPNKNQIQEVSDYWHQVVIPVYIPHQQDYFKDSFKVFKLCLESLKKTVHSKTFISIVNNGSSPEVKAFLDQQFNSGEIHEIIHCPNIGKINAILKGVNGHDFSLVTVTDADVLFLSGWQQATTAIFNSFPKAGAVAPLSFPSYLKYYTAPVWAKYIFSKNLRFEPVDDPESLVAFAKSINNPDFYKPCHLQQQLVLESNGVKAGVGCGHFVNTYRGSIFEPPAGKHSQFQLGGDSEPKFLDEPVLATGTYRLATTTGYVRHMGNTWAPWMQETLEGLSEIDTDQELENPDAIINSSGKIKKWWVNFVFRILIRKPVWKLLLKYKGLSKTQAGNY